MSKYRVEIVREIENLANAKITDFDEVIFGKEKKLDSLNILHILLFIETQYAIKIDVSELSIENFDIINKICSFIERKLINDK